MHGADTPRRRSVSSYCAAPYVHVPDVIRRLGAVDNHCCVERTRRRFNPDLASHRSSPVLSCPQHSSHPPPTGGPSSLHDSSRPKHKYLTLRNATPNRAIALSSALHLVTDLHSESACTMVTTSRASSPEDEQRPRPTAPARPDLSAHLEIHVATVNVCVGFSSLPSCRARILIPCLDPR